MAKNYSKKRRLKYVLLAMTCAASFTFTGLAAACKNDTDDDDDNQSKTSREDEQLLKNGDFEFFNVPEQKEGENAPVYLINSPNSWTHGGTSSYTMSGIIGTSDAAWGKITEPDSDNGEGIIKKLDFNNGLDSSSSTYKDDYIDYNGMKSSDLLYKDSYEAINYKDEDGKTEEDEKKAKEFIENPGTHYKTVEKDGKVYYTDEDGKEVEAYKDENGDYFFDKDFKKPFSHVLMLHNYATDHNGIAQKYTSISLDLPANTAAEISVWVKTDYLLFSQGKEVNQDRGASITVTQTIGSTTLDPFVISCINTEKLNPKPESGEWKNNGWVEYTVYVNACDFSSSTISIELGLGESNYNVEGYAFFDDVSVKKFADINDSSYVDNKDKITVDGKTAVCTLASEKDEKVFKADSYERNNGQVSDPRFSKNFFYHVDLASRAEYKEITFGTGKTVPVTAGLTVDSDNYASSLNNPTDAHVTGGLTIKKVTTDKDRLPKDFKALNTFEDILAIKKAGEEFSANETSYSGRLNKALASAADLPNVNGNTDKNMLVMLSAYGAAYTSTFTLEIAAETKTIVSFWVKTSDMDGGTAATLKITQNGKKTNTSSITLDTTNKSTDIGTSEDEKDIFDGWVQCFFFVNNETEAAAHYTVDFSFGVTSIKDTTVSNYKAGWVALANMRTFEDVDDDIFSYTGSGDYNASLTISEDEAGKTSVFDEAYGSQKHEIENGMVTPSTYTGVNGASSLVVNNGHVSIPFDDTNANKNAGLINKEFVEKYAAKDWYKAILNSFEVDLDKLATDKDTTKALASWYEIFGEKSVQPLVINNVLRNDYIVMKDADESNFKNYLVKNENGEYTKVADDAKFDEKETYYSLKKVLNYGFIGADKTVAADSYATVSVKVKVSKGAVAYVYLVDTAAGKEVLDFTTPEVSFWYDVDGNVLKAEPQDDWTHSQQVANVLYKLRDDGLYEDNDGKLRANTWGLIKTYVNEDLQYYEKDKDGNLTAILFDNLVQGETYFDKDGKEIEHFLENKDGVRIFKFENGNYYYIVKNEVQKDIILPFDKSFARYDNANLSKPYMVEINGNDPAVAGKWVTVNFVIHAGSTSKNYRVELWSGKRDETGVKDGKAEYKEGSTVLFDYSYTNVSDNALMTQYENDIIRDYQELLIDNGVTSFDSSTENISYYEKLAAEKNINADAIKAKYGEYEAHYYTYSFYDSTSFAPFNKDVAEETELGYNYSVNDYSEALAYLKVIDGNTVNVFADYSTVDQSITMNTVDDETDDEEEEEETDSSVWLLISSIILVVAMLFAMISLMVRDMMKKMRRNKAYGNKSSYDKSKANRYMKKLGVKKEEIEEVDNNVDGNAENNVDDGNDE